MKDVIYLLLHHHDDPVEGITISTMIASQASGIVGPKLDTPEPDGFITDSDAALSEEIFDIPMTRVEAIVEPGSVTDDIGRESVTFICIHAPTLSIAANLLVSSRR